MSLKFQDFFRKCPSSIRGKQGMKSSIFPDFELAIKKNYT